MQLRKGLWRSKTLFLKTIKEIKSILLLHHHHKRSNNVPHDKPPKPHHTFNLSCCKNNQHENEIHRQPITNNSHSKNNSFKEPPLEEDIGVKITEKKLDVKRLEMSFGSFRTSVEEFDGTIMKKNLNDDDHDDGNDKGRMLVQKMKQLEMIDLNDEDGVVDVQQVIGYYSCLKSPVYVEMVDRFFVDMYSEFFIRRQPSMRGTASNNSSSRRLGPIKI